ncbi:hypothetical protein LZ198_19470 [Myxococcus sp. K15C18031901]|uniref:hypothetical protein n=1 Tax=Myxococcus dinghuensis TaxID=2906761 RepID=UPI0020A796B8|nr:hypothetical protein [Myxococcus dinghuensis]MCP3101059.1 hypothetical protein [Myxococcus dinghuensis]
MQITFDGNTYETDIPLQKDALALAIDGCKDAWKLEHAISALRFKVFGSDGIASQVLQYMEKRHKVLTAPQVQFQQGFVFRDDRKKCGLCARPLDLDKYGTGHDWFSDSTFSQFICGQCAMGQQPHIKSCSETGCSRLYWACTSYTRCADCHLTKRYQGLATNTAYTLEQVPLNVPSFHAGVQAEVLFRNFIKAQTNLDSICVSSNTGIDIVFITYGDDDYNALMTLLVGPPSSSAPPTTTRFPSRARKQVQQAERGAVIHYAEVKVNEAQCSPAQRNAQSFVDSRIKKALEGGYGEEALKGAKTVESAMNRGADYELHLIRVNMPRYGTHEYTQGAPITAVRRPWGESGGGSGPSMTLLAQCNSITYMDSSWIGDTGERIATQFIRELGFAVRGAVQNNTGNGVDLAAKLDHTPSSPRWAFFEVKASTAKFQTSLEHAEEEQWMFVMDRCTKALLCIDKYTGLTQGTSVHPTTWTVSELAWDFQSPEHWAQRALYFQVAVRLPNPGSNDKVQVKLLAWPGPRSQGAKPLKKDPIPQPLFVGYGGSSMPPPTSNVSKVSMQTLSPHPFGGRYDNLHSCFYMGCDCSLFSPSLLNPKMCSSCQHPHG